MKECCRICTYQKVDEHNRRICCRFPPIAMTLSQEEKGGVGISFAIPPAPDDFWCGEFRMNAALFAEGEGK